SLASDADSRPVAEQVERITRSIHISPHGETLAAGSSKVDRPPIGKSADSQFNVILITVDAGPERRLVRSESPCLPAQERMTSTALQCKVRGRGDGHRGRRRQWRC